MTNVTQRTDHILQLAKTVAAQYGQGYVGTEHLLLAIVYEAEGAGARLLQSKGITPERLQEEVDRQVLAQSHETWVIGRLPGTAHFKDVLSKAAELARGTGNWQICSVHLLLAILAEKDCVGSKTLKALGVSANEVRKGLLHAAAAH